MNDRIYQLAMAAGFYFKITDEIVITPEAGSAGDLNLFAELIIIECANVNYNSLFQDSEFHAREVLDHFGVK
jgi:hypothetical protein